MGVPVHQNKLYNSKSSARDATRGDLHIVACTTCSFVFNASFDLALMSYGADYENDQTHSAAFESHIRALLDGLLTRSGVRNSRIVEIGCGKGNFLRALVESTDSGNSGWGFDPAYTGFEVECDGRLRFVRSFYSSDHAEISPDVVICRHVIEHIPEPAQLLAQTRRASPGARVFLETPDVQWILENVVIWDFFYEHCSYFSPTSFASAFRFAGFNAVEVTKVFGDQYLWVEATAAADDVKDPIHEPGSIAQRVANYSQQEGEMLLRWKGAIERLRKKGPIALWGAGAKGVTSASLFDPAADLIDCVVDVNPTKQGRFIAGSGHAIVSPAELTKLGVKQVILMNPNYQGEVKELLERSQIDATVLVGDNATLLT